MNCEIAWVVPKIQKLCCMGSISAGGKKNCLREAIGDLYGAVNLIVVGVDGKKHTNEQGGHT